MPKKKVNLTTKKKRSNPELFFNKIILENFKGYGQKTNDGIL